MTGKTYLDDIFDEDFLDDLDETTTEKNKVVSKPSWVCDDENHTTYKSWIAIKALKRSKEESIRLTKKLTPKTAKSVYQITKEEVAKQVGVPPQGIFRTSSFSNSILIYFNKKNDQLKVLFNKKLENPNKSTGVRSKKKEELVKSYQSIEKELNVLKRQKTKDVLDLALTKMPIDLRTKLGL